MTTKAFRYLKSREKIRLKKLLQLKKSLSLIDYFHTQSIFSDDSLYFSSFELFMNKKDKLYQGRYFIDEWIVFLIVDKTIKKWLINNTSLENIKILIPYCGSGTVTQIVIECLFIYFKKNYPLEPDEKLFEKIINYHIHSWDVDVQCLDITKKRIQTLFNVEPIIKQTTTILEQEQFDIILGCIPFGNLLSDDFKNSIGSNYDDIALEFIDWAKKSLKQNGEIFCFVNYQLLFDKSYATWRQQQYKNLTLHTIIDFSLHQHKDNPISFTAIGLNNEENYTINHYSLDNNSTTENLSVELFYQVNNNYCINLNIQDS